MKTVKYATGLALGLAVTATVVSGTVSAAPHPTSVRAVVPLTNADDGRTVTVRAGDEVRVQLTGSREQGVMWVWSEPQAGVPATLRRTGGSTSPGGDATAVFEATGSGTSDITSQRRCVAQPGQVCSHAVLLWKATIKVQ
ncbi:hypothetical protein [Streptomyces melanogenes]|uniref:hypothetical protein n=1 Tax=Streptomyces melanogenes TaxID=67326 RepID=UPI00167E934B|nr:hypothetical protein [Streptomyces melanogenes]GGP46826.1 hypothetical protein GCM10010278_24720 [Streptomyces melanogenes]